MNTLVLIGIGGFVGAVLRYLISGLIQNGFLNFPMGTMGVNILGSFVLGFVMFASEYQGIFSDDVRLFLSIGLLGAFTTMSTFSYESLRLLDDGKIGLVLLNVIGTVVLCVFGVYLGKILVMNIWRN